MDGSDDDPRRGKGVKLTCVNKHMGWAWGMVKGFKVNYNLLFKVQEIRDA